MLTLEQIDLIERANIAATNYDPQIASLLHDMVDSIRAADRRIIDANHTIERLVNNVSYDGRQRIEDEYLRRWQKP